MNTRVSCIVSCLQLYDVEPLGTCAAVVRGGKRKLATAEESVDVAEVVQNSVKNERGKATEAKRVKRQVPAVDKLKVTVTDG